MEEEAEEDGTLLMLMRELSVAVINIGGLTAKWWSFLALFIGVFISLSAPTRDAVTDVIFETRVRGKIEEERTVSSRLSFGLDLLRTQVDCRWKTPSK